MKRTIYIAVCPFFCLLLFISGLSLSAQDTTVYQTSNKTLSESNVFIGTQVPLQITAGYEYRFSNRLSARVQAGYINKPYSGYIVNAMEAFGMDKYLARVIKKAFKSGSVISVGPNYHFGKNYVGLYGQYIHLKGRGITPADAFSLYFKKDFTQFNVSGLPTFEFSMQSNILNAGALFGHMFQLRDPRFSINGEAGFSKIVASKNKFSTNRTLIDQTAFARNLYSEIDQEMRDAYWKYGFIPTINVYLIYHL